MIGNKKYINENKKFFLYIYENVNEHRREKKRRKKLKIGNVLVIFNGVIHE